jgi:XTP/dITP diphosphohydrolase
LKLVLASNNAKKLAELQGLLHAAALPIELVAQSALNIAEAQEPHATFIENALAKARHASHASGLPALADDSGLCVDALGGLPGVQSAHIASVDPAELAKCSDREQRRRVQDEANNQWLLDALRAKGNGESGESRAASYVCVLVALRYAQDPEPLVSVGHWRGWVQASAQGQGGFGYDPLMRMEGCDVTVAAMASADKQRLSHRARALATLVDALRGQWMLTVPAQPPLGVDSSRG